MSNIFKKVFQYLNDIGMFRFQSDEKFIKRQYYKVFKKELDLDDPKTFNEKIQWLKLNDRKDIYTKMVDKYEVKNHVSKIIGEEYVIPTLGVWDKFDDIDFDKLPNQFVLKCTHDSGGLVICKDKKNFNYKKAKFKFNLIMKRNFYYRSREWPYKNVKPRIIAEPYLVDETFNELRDYKFFVFSGKVEIMFIASNRQGEGDTYFDFYDRNFNHLHIINGHPMSPSKIEPPKNYKKMIELAEKLSDNLPQIRVDFYEINGKVYFGELTFYHWSGLVKFEPEEWDLKLGKLIKIKKG